jgi:hypothetical protein
MANQKRQVLKSCLARFVRLDTCGNPVTGVGSQLVTKGFISIALTAQIEPGEEVLLKNACGELLVNEKDCDRFKRYDVEGQFAGVNPDLMELLTSARLIVDGDDSIGFAFGESDECESFSVELWNQLANPECEVGAEPEWLYTAIPWVNNGMLGDMAFNNQTLNLTITGSTRGTGSAWGRGPSCVVPAGQEILTTEHLVAVVTSVQPPTPTDDLEALTGADLVCA